MSAYATVGGLPVVDFRLTMPRWGVWVCEASLVDDRQPPPGKCEIAVGDNNKLQGTLEMAATAYDSTVVRVRAGGGGMGTIATPKHYSNASLRLVLSDLLKKAGELLSTTADVGVLATQLPHWATLQWPTGRAVAQLIAAAGDDVAWRHLPDGTVWVGREQWKPVTPEHELLQVNPLVGNLMISSLDALVLPGDSFAGEHISYVEHSLLDGRIRSSLSTEPA